jgi:THO complex subunit 4
LKLFLVLKRPRWLRHRRLLASALREETADSERHRTKTDILNSQQKSAKAQPKPATAPKKATGDRKTGKAQRGRRGGGRNEGRGKPKTAEELDAEMNDYWVTGTNGAGGDTTMGTNGGPVQPAGNGDAAMEDEIEV